MLRATALLATATLVLTLWFTRVADPGDFAPTCDAGPTPVLATAATTDTTVPKGPIVQPPVTCWQCELINWWRCWNNPDCTLVPCAFICP